MSTDVLVVGAGPTGLFLAHELARQGLRCRVIDKLEQPTDKSKAFAIHARTMETFDSAGIADDFAAAGMHVRRTNLYGDGARIARVSFDALPTRFRYILSLPQSDTERLLARLLAGRGVQVERPVELVSFEQDASGVTARLRRGASEDTVRAAYIVGCDGAHSTVRHALGIEFEGVAYEETFGLADVSVGGKLASDEMHLFITTHGILLALAFGEGRYRLVANLPAEEGGSDEMTVSEWREILAKRAPADLRIADPRWMSRFRIHRRHTRQLRKGRAFLAGDAAHIHSPAGGQGMNTGLQDVANLAWKLALAARGRASPKLLDSYEAERRPIHAQVLSDTDRLTRIGLAGSKSKLLTGLMHHVLPLVIPLVQGTMTRKIAELEIAYRKSPICAEKRLAGGPAAGEHAPDGEVSLGGAPHRLVTLLRHGAHTLLLFNGIKPKDKTTAALSRVGETVARDYRDLVVPHLVVAGKADAPAVSWDRAPLVDADRSLHDAYGAKDACMYLVRPDGYVAFRGPASAGAELVRLFGRTFRAQG